MKHRIKSQFFIIALFLLLCFIAVSPASGEDAAKKRIVTKIEVKNNKTISAQSILAKVQTQQGKEFLPNIVSDDIKKLFATGYFDDVTVDIEDYEQGVKVTFIVVEKPVIGKIQFSGNKRIRKERLKEKIQLKENELIDHQVIKNDVKTLADFYIEKGHSSSSVNYKVDVDEKNVATVSFIINEGKAIKISRIKITGNKAFKSGRLLKIIKTKKTWLFGRGFFKKDTFEEDIERLKSFYRESGYLDVTVEHEIEYIKKNRFMIIKFNINEGQKYIAGDITIAGNKIFSELMLKEKISMKSGSVYSQELLKEDISNVQGFYFGKGYIYARIKVDTFLNPDSGRVDMKYNIEEGDIAYVDKIKIRGNTRTKDIVIRRELKLTPGERFDGDKLQRSKERLYNLGYFEEVSYDTEPGSEKNKEDLLVNVKETKTGEFSFGAGYSSVDKFVGFVDIVQKNFDILNFPNFTGGGQRLRARAEFGTTKQDYELSFTEPWLLGRPIEFGVDAYQRTHEWEQYSQQNMGFDLRLGKELKEYLRGSIAYRNENVKIYDLDTGASSEIRGEEGKNLICSVTPSLTKDTRDNVFDPTRGYVANGSIEVAGGMFGGDKDFVKYTTYNSWYFPYFKKTVLELKLRSGYVDAYDDTTRVPIYERFYAGGATTLRGFKERHVGPVDTAGDPVGGRAMFIANAEYLLPLVKNVNWAIFYDTGNVWDTFNDFDLADFRSSAGLGLRVKTPMGPLKLDYGYVLDRKTGESKDRVHFSVGYSF